jgi:site-specific DNA recombinase
LLLIQQLDTNSLTSIVQLEKEQKSINQHIINIEKQKTKLIQLLASDVITQQEYRDVVNQNEVSLKQFLQTKLQIDNKLSKTDNQEQIKKLQIELSQFATIDVLTPELLHRIIERIEIKADGTSRIFYRFSLPSAIV